MTARTLRVHDGVRADRAEIAQYYAKESPQQIARFLNAYAARRGLIGDFPYSQPILFEDYRHSVLKPVFEYMIIYVIEEATVDILAVFHGKRDPDWIKQEVRERTFD